MKIFTTHVQPSRPPLLVREGFSWTALVFGVFFFAWHRAWNAVAVDLAAVVLAGVAGHYLHSGLPVIGVLVLQGVLGLDMLRWGLEMHGYVPGPVVAARDHDAALGRLLDERQDMLGGFSELAEARF